MPASDHSEPVNIQDAPVLSRTVSDRAKVFRIAKSMVKKRVPNHRAPLAACLFMVSFKLLIMDALALFGVGRGAADGRSEPS